MSKDKIMELMMRSFSCGVSQGLIYANDEKENRINYESMLGVAFDRETATPLQLGNIIEPQPKSKKWIAAHKKEIAEFYELLLRELK